MQFFLEFKFIVVSSIVLLFLCASDGAKILSVFGYPGPSQYIMASALLKELAKRGHEVTSISTFPQKQPLKNFRDIAVMENAKLYDSLTTEAVESQTETGYFKTFNDLSSVGCKMVQNILENPQVQNIMKNEKFDLIIMELFINDALYGLGQHFNAPMIGVSTFGTINFIDVLVNNISPISYIPHMGLTYNNHITLQERLWNAIYSILDDLHFNYIRLPPQEKLYKKYFPHSQKTFEEVMKNFSLVLLNQHFSLSYPRPYVPNMIEVGGLHIKQKPDPLPQDLQEILDNAKEGVIYFSMGSNFKSKYIPSETLNIFLDTFRELKIKVLWKFEDDSLTNKPPNVIIKPWYPQPSVLAHPNVKLFISHGGFLSTTETIFHGKPILGIPILGDQPMNVANAVKAGYALSLKLKEITKEDFKSKIIELLTNESYTKKVQKLSRQYRDQPQTPLEKAVYWIEYVLRHEGAEHLRNAGVDLNYFQRNSMDVLVILAGGLLLIIAMLVVLIGLVVKLLVKKSSPRIKVKHN